MVFRRSPNRIRGCLIHGNAQPNCFLEQLRPERQVRDSLERLSGVNTYFSFILAKLMSEIVKKPTGHAFSVVASGLRVVGTGKPLHRRYPDLFLSARGKVSRPISLGTFVCALLVSGCIVQLRFQRPVKQLYLVLQGTNR